MKLTRIAAVSFLCILMAVSCNKNDQPGYPGDFLDCHLQTNWTQESTANYLIGKWQMIYAQDPSGQLPLENVILIFTDDKILRVFKEGQPILTTHFDVLQQDAQTYGIFTSDYSPYTDGRLLFCGGQMECNNGYIGGQDHYFRKAQ